MIPLAPNAMSTLEILKEILSIDNGDTSYDNFLTFLINYASAWVERITGRHFGLDRYLEELAGSGQQKLVLKEYPIRTIFSVFDKESGSDISSESYSFLEDGEIGVVYKDDGWGRRAYPIGLVPDYVHTKRYLRVSYQAGYVLPKDVTEDTPLDWILPYDLQGIIWQIAAQELALADSGADGLSAFGIADVSWTFDKTPRQSWLDILSNYIKAV